MKLLFSFVLTAFALISPLTSNAQGAGQPMPDFMKKMLCERTPNTDICQKDDKIARPITPKQGSSSERITPEVVSSQISLKGFNLALSKAELKRLNPNLIYAVEFSSVEGKEVGNFRCGPKLTEAGNNCSFTYAGIPITNIHVKLWGDRIVAIRLFFNDYIPGQNKREAVNIRTDLKAALDSKYSSPNTLPEGGSQGPWIVGSERLSISRVNTPGIQSDSLVLYDIGFYDLWEVAINKHISEAEQKSNNNKLNKLKSDM